MSDLEARVRDALRGNEIGWDDLRQPTLRVAPRTPRRWPAMLATAAAIAVVASVVAALTLTGHGSSGPAGNHPAYAGYAWQLIGLTDRHGPIPDAASVPGQIAYSDTAVSGTLASASIFGHYQPTSHGYQLTDLGIAGGATSIRDRSQARIGNAFGRLFLDNAQIVTARPSDLATVTAHVSGKLLVLQANGVTMRLSRIGPARLSPVIDAVGYTWNVQALTDEHGQLTIPHRLHATVGLARYGLVLVKDTVNTLEGEFGLSNDGYVVGHQVSSTANGYAGHDPTVLRLKAAVDAMVARNAAVTASVDGDTLTLHRGAITLTLQRGATMPTETIESGGASASLVPAPRASS
jgi:hypothetical protein